MDNRELWPGWETVRLIGRGNFGAVYEIERNILGTTERAALKVISIPQHENDIEEMYSNGYDEESITSTFKYHLKSIVEEYSMMRKMSECLHIVSCDDVRFVQHDDGIGWDIFIKMELLTPLTKALPVQVSEETVLKVAKDLCSALDACKQYNIVHRDIKPQNIFRSPSGNYKLGDFGIAKTVEKTMGGTKIGTYSYMAPEVYNNKPYGSGADIYSLGLVLYWLLNERRLPFLPLPPAKMRMGMDEEARKRRLSGEQFAEPKHGSGELKAIVMKACADNVEDRYTSASEMLADLNRIGQERLQQTGIVPAIQPSGTGSYNCTKLEDADKTVGIFGKPDAADTLETKLEEETVGLFSKPDAGKICEESADAEPEQLEERPEEQAAKTHVLTQEDFADNEDLPELSNPGPKKSKLLVAIGAAAAVIILAIAIMLPGMKKSNNQSTVERPAYSGPEATKNTIPEAQTQNGMPPAATEAKKPPATEAREEAPQKHNTPVPMVDAGNYHSVYLRSDGTVAAKGSREKSKHANRGLRCDVSGWTDIVAISASSHTVGVKKDGTVVATGVNTYGQCDIDSWRDIVAVSAGDNHTLGLRSDGTVVAKGCDDLGQCDVSGWRNITRIAAGPDNSYGLRENGTVVMAGGNASGQGDVSGWTKIKAISAANRYVVGLKTDGTVVTAGTSEKWIDEYSNWTDIVAISAGSTHMVGLKSDGTVVACGRNDANQCDVGNWEGIASVSAGMLFTLGMKKDGTLVAVGDNSFGQRDIVDYT